MQTPALDCDMDHQQVVAELAVELHPAHPLFGVEVQIVAHDLHDDNVVCQHVNDSDRFTTVHLTWSRSEETGTCPTIECDGSWQTFLDWNSAVEAALQQASALEEQGLRVPLGETGTSSRPIIVTRPDTSRQ
jgi:hypothetical protein